MSTAAAWVQALAALVLIGVTVRYVALTHQLSRTAEHQLSAMLKAAESARRAELREFAYLAKRLAEMVRALPLSNSIANYGGLINGAALWTSDDLASFGILAARCGDRYATGCVKPLIDLEWLRERTLSVKAAYPNTGSVLTNMPWQDWYARQQETLEALDQLHYQAVTATSKALDD